VIVLVPVLGAAGGVAGLGITAVAALGLLGALDEFVGNVLISYGQGQLKALELQINMEMYANIFA
jgi:hypothetical protein